MKNNRGIESLFIGTLIITTLMFGIYTNIYYSKVSISSICFAISITSLIYWFLGGVEAASFNIGWLKLGGSIAVLLGSFVLITAELRKDSSYELSPRENCAIFSKTKGTPQTLFLKYGGEKIDSVESISNTFWAKNNLTLTENLQIKNNDFVMGKLTRDNLRTLNYFSDVHETGQAEYFKMNMDSHIKSELLGFSIKSRKFKLNDIFEFQFKLNGSDKSIIETLKNKEIKIIKIVNEYFVIAGLQANFLETDKLGNQIKKYFQISIKPLEFH